MRPRRVLNSLRLFWVLVILWGEWGIFQRTGYSWPEGSISAEYSTKIVIIADPQILDMQAYPDRPWLLRLLSQVMVDLNLRRSWKATQYLRPDAIVFLGDMMDRGRRNIPDPEYEAYYQRFSSIFAKSENVPTPTYYLPGNHDVGLGRYDSISPQSRQRYNAKFGSVPSAIRFGNFTVLLIDAPLLVDEEASPGLSASPHLARIRQLAREAPGPIVLFSHIPLARPDQTDCGPLRERGTIRAGYGQGYQNTLSSAMSRELITAVQPVMVFSGDDHDYCDTTAGGVHEVSVKSFSMAMGIRRPGFHLLSLLPQQTIGPFADSPFLFEQPCFLPDQLGIYLKFYVPLVICSLIALALYHVRQRTKGQRSISRDERDSLPSPSVTTRRSARAAEGCGLTFAKDIGTVAWPPVLLFAFMAWCSFL